MKCLCAGKTIIWIVHNVLNVSVCTASYPVVVVLHNVDSIQKVSCLTVPNHHLHSVKFHVWLGHNLESRDQRVVAIYRNAKQYKKAGN